MCWKPKGKKYDDNCWEIAPWLVRKIGVKVIDWSRTLTIVSMYFIYFLSWLNSWALVSFCVVLPEMISLSGFFQFLLNFWGNFDQGMNCISCPTLVPPVRQSRHSVHCASCLTLWVLRSRTILGPGPLSWLCSDHAVFAAAYSLGCIWGRGGGMAAHPALSSLSSWPSVGAGSAAALCPLRGDEWPPTPPGSTHELLPTPHPPLLLPSELWTLLPWAS